jgi:predicted MFS family arabinose efflux permease
LDPEHHDPDLRRLRRNAPLVCAFHALHMALFPIAVLTLFLRDELGLRMFDVFVLQAAFGAMVALLEFPAGYVADRIGYRRTLIAAAVLQLIGWTAYTRATDFVSVLLAEQFLAASLALISGADTALLYETLLALREETGFARWYARYRSLGSASEGTAALVGSLLFVHWPRLPFVLQSLLWVGAFALVLPLVEPTRDRGPELSTFARVRGLLRYAAFDQPRLRSVVTLYVALSLPTFVMVWILPPYVQESGVSPAWLGPIWAASNYAIALSSLWAPRIGERLGLRGALGMCVLLIAVGYGGLGLTHASWGFCFYLALCVCRGVQIPLLHHEEQRLIPSSDRAALLSLNSLAFRSSFVLVGPVIGHALDLVDQHTVLLCAGAAFTLIAASAWLWFVQSQALARHPAEELVR